MDFEIQNNGKVFVSHNKEITYYKGIGEIIFNMLMESKGRVFQIDGITGREDTYEDFLRRCVRTAISMRSRGIRSEDIVTVCSFNHLDTNVPIVASLFLGVKTANIHPALSLHDTVDLLGLVRPKMIFVVSDAVDLIEKAIAEIGISPCIVVFGETNRHTGFAEFIQETQEERTFTPTEVRNLQETAVILFSSGTTGLPKGVCLPHLSFISWFEFPWGDDKDKHNVIFLSYSTPYWISSFVFLLATIYNRSTRLILPCFDVKQFWSSIDKYKVSYLFLTNYEISRIVNAKIPEGANGLSLKMLAFGGSHINSSYFDHVRKLFPNISVLCNCYGQTEMGGLVFYFKNKQSAVASEWLNKEPLTIGRPLLGYSCKIVDPETEEILGPNQQGELRVKSVFGMNGYYNADSSDAWDEDGFFKSGDIGYYDEDSYFYVVDRLNHMIKFRGFQLAAIKLEAVLQSHPAVESAVVIGIPHPDDGDHPMGIVVLKESVKHVRSEDIARYFEENVSDNACKLRAGVKIVDKIPITTSKKFKKTALKEMVFRGEL